MRNILVTLKYVGTKYHGWQVQENANTVQAEVQKAAEVIIGAPTDVTGCSRTDAGVHANKYCCTLRTESDIDCYKLKGGLNAKLPEDIGVMNCEDVDLEFHPRYSCTAKQYVYKIYNGGSKDPFLQDLALDYHRPLDEAFLDSQAKDFLGTHDFTSFCSIKSDVPDNIRTVYDASVIREGDLVIFRVTADGFLYNMVRIMVGTLLFISEGKLEPGSIPQIIEEKDRHAAGITARPEGLYLNEIYYDKRW